MTSWERASPGKKGKKYFFLLFEQVFIFLVCSGSQIMEPLLARWVTFAFGRQGPHQETRSLTLCLPLLCSWATLWTCTWTEPLEKIWKLDVVPILGLGAQPFFLRGVQSPSCRFKHHWQVSFSWGYYVPELKLQFQLPTSPHTEQRCKFPERFHLESKQIVKWKDVSRPKSWGLTVCKD